MEKKELKPKKENIFKRMLKNVTQPILKWDILRKPEYKRYVRLPDYVKCMYDVKIAVLRNEIKKDEKNKWMMCSDESIPFTTDEILSVLKDIDEGLFSYLSWERKKAVLSKDDRYLERCTTEDKLKFIQSNPNQIEKLDEDFQFKLLTKEHDKPAESDNGLRKDLSHANQIKPVDYSKKLDQFSTEVVKRVIKHYLKEAKEKAGNKDTKNETFLEQIKIDNLPVELQLEIANLDTRFVKLMSEDAAKEYVADNPMLVNYLSLEMKKQMIAKRIELLDVLNRKDIEDLREILIFLSKQPGIQVPDEYKIKNHIIFKDEEPVTNEEPFKRIILQGYMPILLGDAITKSLGIIPELAIFDPDAIGDVFDFETSNETREKMIEEFKRKIKEISQQDFENIDKLLESLKEIDHDTDLKCGNILKVLLNERVLTKVPEEQILKFTKDPYNRETLLEIVELAYGEKARQQLEKHPEITIDKIGTLDILDPIILEKLGEGTVSNMLAYNSLGGLVLGDLARHPEEIEKFEAFKKLFDEKNEDALGLNNKLIMFGEFKELFVNIDLNNLTQQQKDTVILIYHDYFMMKNLEQNLFMKVVSLDDIDSYEERRSQILKDYLEKSTDVSTIKNAIAVRFFGMQYSEYENTGSIGSKNKENIDLVGMVEHYNLDRFLKDDRTVHSDLFTENELDMLEIVRIIKEIDDPITLKKIYITLESRTDVLRPVDFSKTKSKIPLQYSRELVSSLLTVESAKARAKDEADITYENVDGYDIIGLEGASFNLMMVPNNRANSELGGQIVGEFINHDSLAQQFKIHCGAYKLAYMNIPKGQVVTMGNHIDTSHQSRNSLEGIHDIRHAKFNYPDQTIAKYDEMMDENRRTMVRMPGTHIVEGEPEYGEKINLEIAIVVNGEITDEIRKKADELGKDGKPATIIKVNYARYGTRHRSTFKQPTVQREDSELMKSIKKVLEPEGEAR